MLDGSADPHESSLEMYLRLREDNPTPFEAFTCTLEVVILSTYSNGF